MAEEPLQGVALIVRAIELTIAQVKERVDDPDRDESLEVLREMRRRWQAQLVQMRRGFPGWSSATSSGRGRSGG